jgi:hypothetical protein
MIGVVRSTLNRGLALHTTTCKWQSFQTWCRNNAGALLADTIRLLANTLHCLINLKDGIPFASRKLQRKLTLECIRTILFCVDLVSTRQGSTAQIGKKNPGNVLLSHNRVLQYHRR